MMGWIFLLAVAVSWALTLWLGTGIAWLVGWDSAVPVLFTCSVFVSRLSLVPSAMVLMFWIAGNVRRERSVAQRVSGRARTPSYSSAGVTGGGVAGSSRESRHAVTRVAN